MGSVGCMRSSAWIPVISSVLTTWTPLFASSRGHGIDIANSGDLLVEGLWIIILGIEPVA